MHKTILLTIVILTSVSSALGQNYCTPSFTGNCSTSGAEASFQYLTTIGMFKPAGSLETLQDFTAIMGICPTPSSCNTADSTDYQHHQIGGAGPICPGYGGFGVGTDGYQINSSLRLVDSTGFDIFLQGNSLFSDNDPFLSAISIFIDWNQDGDFDELNELVLSTPQKKWDSPSLVLSGPSQNVYSVIPPLEMIDGMSRMRVIVTPFQNSAPCVTAAEGSARDFDIFINSPFNCPDADGDLVCDTDDQCPNFDDNLIGESCDDGFDNTTNDTWTDCNICQGIDQGCEGDFDGDGQITVDDFILLNSSFGNSCLNCPEDITGDGMVDVNDFVAFNTQFGWVCGQ